MGQMITGFVKLNQRSQHGTGAAHRLPPVLPEPPLRTGQCLGPHPTTRPPATPLPNPQAGYLRPALSLCVLTCKTDTVLVVRMKPVDGHTARGPAGLAADDP